MTQQGPKYGACDPCCRAPSDVVLNFFRAGPEQVRWELTKSEVNGPCRLRIQHANGVVVETYASTAMALRRVQELEDLLAVATGSRSSDVPVEARAEQSAANVLVIDDDELLARAFVRVLTSEGYRARAVHSASDALRALTDAPPDVILLDYRMPFINGVGFLYRLREQPAYQRTPVLVVTGDPGLTDEAREELRALGAELRLKPFGVDELITTVRGLLHRTDGP